MAHIRKSIRDNVVTTLTGLTTTGANVFQTRVYPLASNKLPGLAIYTRSESSDYSTITMPRNIIRTMTVSVEAYVKGVTGTDDSLDTIASEIEAALYSDVTRGGLAKDTRVVSFEADFSGDPDQPVGTATINVDIDYVTIEGAPETAV
jgi:hypothetical protein